MSRHPFGGKRSAGSVESTCKDKDGKREEGDAERKCEGCGWGISS